MHSLGAFDIFQPIRDSCDIARVYKSTTCIKAEFKMAWMSVSAVEGRDGNLQIAPPEATTHVPYVLPCLDWSGWSPSVSEEGTF